MNKFLLHCLVLTLLVALRAFGEPVPVVKYERPFTLKERDGNFVLKIYKPAPDGTPGHDGAHEDLKAFVRFARADAEARGFINDMTRERYEREFRMVEEGYWPTIYVTNEKTGEILMGYCYAIQWRADERLPFQHSFYDLGIPGQPAEEPLVQQLIEPFKENTFHKYLSLHYLPNENYFRRILHLRPFIGGTSTEIKFLCGNTVNPIRFLPTIHQASIEFELHRDSRVKVSAEAWAEYREWVRENGVAFLKPPLLVRDPSTPNEAEDRLITKYLHEHLYDESWQVYVRNTRVFVQASDLIDPRAPLRTVHWRLFVEKLGFSPEVFWRFKETAKTGTPGVRTRILVSPTQDYEWLTGINIQQLVTGDDPTFSIVFSPTAPSPCRDMYSRIEAGLDAYVLSR